MEPRSPAQPGHPSSRPRGRHCPFPQSRGHSPSGTTRESQRKELGGLASSLSREARGGGGRSRPFPAWGAFRGAPRASVWSSVGAGSWSPPWEEALEPTCGLSRGAVGPGLEAGRGRPGRLSHGRVVRRPGPIAASPSAAPPPCRSAGRGWGGPGGGPDSWAWPGAVPERLRGQRRWRKT